MAQTLQLLIKFIESVESRRPGRREGRLSGGSALTWESAVVLQPLLESFDSCDPAGRELLLCR